MMPEAESENLLYVSKRVPRHCPRDCGVQVYSFPSGKQVGALQGFHDLQTLCSDNNGNVWITDDLGGYRVGPGKIFKYAHGATKPIITLTESDPPTACSVESSTGNLAVVNSRTYSNVLAVFKGGRGKPTFYAGASTEPYSCTYDDKGDIFIADLVSTYANGVDWLPNGASKIRYFPNKPRTYPEGGVLWHGPFLTANGRKSQIIRYTIVNDKFGEEVGTTVMYGAGAFTQYWIADGLVIGTTRDGIQMWKYPAGGNAVATIHDVDPFGVTVSMAPQ